MFEVPDHGLDHRVLTVEPVQLFGVSVKVGDECPVVDQVEEPRLRVTGIFGDGGTPDDETALNRVSGCAALDRVRDFGDSELLDTSRWHSYVTVFVDVCDQVTDRGVLTDRDTETNIVTSTRVDDAFGI